MVINDLDGSPGILAQLRCRPHQPNRHFCLADSATVWSDKPPVAVKRREAGKAAVVLAVERLWLCETEKGTAVGHPHSSLNAGEKGKATSSAAMLDHANRALVVCTMVDLKREQPAGLVRPHGFQCSSLALISSRICIVSAWDSSANFTPNPLLSKT
jgi:hypothetical protein